MWTIHAINNLIHKLNQLQNQILHQLTSSLLDQHLNPLQLSSSSTHSLTTNTYSSIQLNLFIQHNLNPEARFAVSHLQQVLHPISSFNPMAGFRNYRRKVNNRWRTNADTEFARSGGFRIKIWRMRNSRVLHSTFKIRSRCYYRTFLSF